LTLVAVAAGRVRYQFGNRDLWIDDDVLLVVNGGHWQRVSIDEPQPTEVLQLFFPDCLLRDVYRNSTSCADALLTNPMGYAAVETELLEGLLRHSRRLTSALHFVRHCVRTSDVSAEWLDEQAHFLLDSLLALQQRRERQIQALQCVRRATRIELYRRAARAADWIDSQYAGNCGLDELAAVACLSKFHLLRLFKQIYGVTPQSYKEQRRVLAARRLQRSSALSMAEIAERVGYASAASLRVQLGRWGRGDQVSNNLVSNSQLPAHA
jgi:AraC-like DNA-binding protein